MEYEENPLIEWLKKVPKDVEGDDFDAGALRLKAEDVKGGKRPRIVPMVRRVHRTLNLKKKTASTAFIFESREFKRALAQTFLKSKSGGDLWRIDSPILANGIRPGIGS